MRSFTRNRYVYPIRVTFDPNRNEQVWITSFTSQSVPQWSISKLGSQMLVSGLAKDSSRTVYSSKFALPPGEIVPIDSLHVLHLGPDRFFRLYGPEAMWMEDGSRPTEFKLGLSDDFSEVLLQRLYGARILAAGIDRERDSLVLVVQMLDGDTVSSYGRYIEPGAQMPFILQSPRDSMIVMLLSSRAGPVVQLLGPNLQTLDSSVDVPSSELAVSSGAFPVRNIVGSIVQDTLYVAWTDDRRGGSQVYMNATPLPRDRSWQAPESDDVDPEVNPALPPEVTSPAIGLLIDGRTPAERIQRSGFAIVRIAPNPAFDNAGVTIGSDSARRLTLSQYDVTGQLLGRRKIDVTAGENVLALPDVYSYSGLYYIELSTQLHSESVPHVVFGD
jgi:hypothetical protein